MPAIGFMPKHGNWYPKEDIELIRPSIEPLLSKYKTRLAYGFSMGGYGAIKHSRALGATHVLAMSPQWSIDPEVAPWERRYLHFIDKCSENMEIVDDDCGGEIYVIFDNMNKDRFHAEKISSAAAVNSIQAPLTGHDTWKLFLSSATMRALFDAVFNGDKLRMFQIVRERRRLLPDIQTRVLWARALKHFRVKRYAEAERVARQADAAPNRVPGAAWLLGAILLETKRPSEAEVVLRAEMRRFPSIRWLGGYLVRAIEMQGHYSEAMAVLEPQLASQPHRVDLQKAAQRIAAKLA
ncbi:hypothetical protein GCM10011320_22020 [Neoroseomonas lacus]|uniref:Tetratricopeptide repeat protein n=2 Tax=Neoroseomonas lacus TaxID=287609 RepID=A0A917NNM8_9PROT|nr:hypothetical protein GCM10011320_22020 [Neoroseomonas lacus]